MKKDAYFMSSQTNIFVTIVEVKYIIVLDVLLYFYQWEVKSQNKLKQTIISHRDQEQVNVIIMKFIDFSIHVQRQTNRMLFECRSVIKSFINNIIIFFNNFENHLIHLKKIFIVFTKYKVILNLKKAYVKYFSLIVLVQIVNDFEFIIAKKKIAIIINLAFFKALKILKYYLNFTKWLRLYVLFYAQITKSFQRRKTLLMKIVSSQEKWRKNYVKSTKIFEFTLIKMIVYEHLQSLFFIFIFLAHHDSNRRLYIDVVAFKQMIFKVMIFDVKDNFKQDILFKRKNI